MCVERENKMNARIHKHVTPVTIPQGLKKKRRLHTFERCFIKLYPLLSLPPLSPQWPPSFFISLVSFLIQRCTLLGSLSVYFFLFRSLSFWLFHYITFFSLILFSSPSILLSFLQSTSFSIFLLLLSLYLLLPSLPSSSLSSSTSFLPLLEKKNQAIRRII